MCRLNNFIVLTINLLKHTLLFYKHTQKKQSCPSALQWETVSPDTDDGKQQKRDVPGSFPDHDIVG